MTWVMDININVCDLINCWEHTQSHFRTPRPSNQDAHAVGVLSRCWTRVWEIKVIDCVH